MVAIAHVGIVGAGLAGLACALAVVRAGLEVDLFEAQPQPSDPPAHIDLVPNLLRDLVALGVGIDCVRRGFPYNGLAVLDDDGALRFEMPTPRLAGGLWPGALGMVYGDLLDILRRAAQSAGVRLHHGTRVVDAWDDGAVVTSQGTRHPVDLAVVASGSVRPTVGGQSLPAVPQQRLGQQWCHALLPRPRHIERAAWVIGHGAVRALLVPVGAARTGVALMQPDDAEASPIAMRRAMQAGGSLLRSLSNYLTDEVTVLPRAVRSGVLPGPWHHEGALRIGHSAHRMPPHFGQGAAQVVEDAQVLGDLLSRRPDRASLFKDFMARRGERARRAHDCTVQAARWQQRPQADTDLQALSEQLAPLMAHPA